MQRKLRIAVIFGGRSGEHEVSLVSAESVMKNLDRSKYEVVPIGITRDGKWLTTNNSLDTLKAGSSPKLTTEKIISPDTTKKRLVPVSKKYLKTGMASQGKIDVIIPVLHGTYGEDGTVQGLLELAGIAYVGANVLASAVGMDKIIQKQLFSQVGLPIVKYVHYLSKQIKREFSKISRDIAMLGYPVFVKPANLGSSVGISIVHTKKNLKTALLHAAEFDRKLIVEKAVMNPREIEAAVLGNDSPKVSVLGEVIASSGFYDYDAKYIDGLSYTVIPAKLGKKKVKEIQAFAIKAFKTIDCSGMARVDFLLTQQGKIYLSEVNTIPGFTSISMYPKLWEASGIKYPKLLDKLITLALERQRERDILKTFYKPKEKWYT